MASTFKNAGLDVGVLDTTAGDIYTASGSGVTAVIHAVYISNLSATNFAKFILKVKIDGGSNDEFYSNKIITARYFVLRMLPMLDAHFAKIKTGAEPIMALKASAF